jgi:hypothetical protein
MDSLSFAGNEMNPAYFDIFVSPGPMRWGFTFDGSGDTEQDAWRKFDDLHISRCNLFIRMRLNEPGFEMRWLASPNANPTLMTDALTAKDWKDPSGDESGKCLPVNTSMIVMCVIHPALMVHEVGNNDISEERKV